MHHCRDTISRIVQSRAHSYKSNNKPFLFRPYDPTTIQQRVSHQEVSTAFPMQILKRTSLLPFPTAFPTQVYCRSCIHTFFPAHSPLPCCSPALQDPFHNKLPL